MKTVDTWFLWAYEHLGETFADVPVLEQEAGPTEEEAAPAAARKLVSPHLAGISEWLVAPGSTGPTLAPNQEVRFLAPQSLVDLYDFFRVTASPAGSGPLASYSTFRRCYLRRWQRVLRIRVQGHQPACPDCERYKALRKMVSTTEEVHALLAEYRKHLAAQYDDRRTDARISNLAETAILTGEVPFESDLSILSICMDGMDQAKFRCPRQLSLSKEFQSCRRPELHATGAVVDGLLESYWLSDCNVPKNANLQLTLLSRALQQSADLLAKGGRGRPAVLRVHTDNATSEGKNQTVMKYMAWLVWKRTFRACEMT
ncbi:MAG: hypothetical protein GY772_13275, partial [bacterium]|nr:hypothetical protein [bacterium]